MESLSALVIRSGLWMVGLKLTVRLLGLVRLFVLVRLLRPRDFGLVGIALVVISLFEAFSATGSQAALIQRQSRARELFDTAWTLACLRGGLMATLLLISGPAVGRFFGSPDGGMVVQAMALVPLIGGLNNIGMVEFRQELAFGPHYRLHSIGVLADLCVAVPLALWLGNAWALVGGAVADAAARLVASYVLHPYRPRPRLDWGQAQTLFRFGRWVFGSTAIRWLLNDGVQAVVGRLLGVQALAFYQMSWRLASLPTTEVTNVIASVTVAAYAKLQEVPDRIGRAYLRVLTVVALAALPIAVGIVVHGEDLVRILLGNAWITIVPVVQILALRGLARSIGATSGPLFQGVGRPRLQTFVALFELGIVASLLGPLTLRLGPVGAAIAASIGSFAGAVAALLTVTRLLRIPWRELMPILGWPLLACLPFAIGQVWLWGSRDTPVGLVGAIGLSGLMYVGGVMLLDRLGLYTLDPAVVSRARRWVSAAFVGE